MDRSDFTVPSSILSTHLSIWACGSTWWRHTSKHGEQTMLTMPAQWQMLRIDQSTTIIKWKTKNKYRYAHNQEIYTYVGTAKTLGLCSLLHLSVKIKHSFLCMYHFAGLPKISGLTMLQRSVHYVISTTTTFQHTVAVARHFGTNADNVQAQGPKCPGLWSELSQH